MLSCLLSFCNSEMRLSVARVCTPSDYRELLCCLSAPPGADPLTSRDTFTLLSVWGSGGGCCLFSIRVTHTSVSLGHMPGAELLGGDVCTTYRPSCLPKWLGHPAFPLGTWKFPLLCLLANTWSFPLFSLCHSRQCAVTLMKPWINVTDFHDVAFLVLCWHR